MIRYFHLEHCSLCPPPGAFTPPEPPPEPLRPAGWPASLSIGSTSYGLTSFESTPFGLKQPKGRWYHTYHSSIKNSVRLKIVQLFWTNLSKINGPSLILKRNEVHILTLPLYSIFESQKDNNVGRNGNEVGGHKNVQN